MEVKIIKTDQKCQYFKKSRKLSVFITILATPMYKDMTPADRVLYNIRTLIRTGNRYPGSLGLRRNRDISSAAAYQTKLAVQSVTELSQDDIDAISKKKATLKTSGQEIRYAEYLQQFQRLAADIQGKQDMKNISTGQDQYAVLVKQIREAIEDFLQEQFVKIDADIKKTKTFITDKHNTMSREEFQETYGEKVYTRRRNQSGDDFYYSLSKFENSKLGIILRLRDIQIPEFITKAQESYREKEYHKIDKLVFKLKARFPALQNFVITNFNKDIDGIEFVLSADSPEGKVVIDTSTIYAGGYNIQRLHLRWLMHVSAPSGDVDIKQN